MTSTISGFINNFIPSVSAQPSGKEIVVDSSGLSYKITDKNSYRSNEYSSYNSYGSNEYDSDSSNYYGSNEYDTSSNNDYYPKEKKVLAEIEKDDNKLFICDNGIVVDDRINCPQKCPFNTPLEGVYVMDLDVCLTQPGVGVTCPLDTDLPGVVVTDEANCNIFETCDASSTPLGVALGQDVKVADSALCQLSNVPNLQICEDGPFEGFAVNDQDACDTLDNVQICSLTSDLPGVLTTDPATCNIFETCDLNTPLGASLGTNVEVVDADICQLQFAVCDSDSGLARALGLTGTIVVADVKLCELAVTSGTTTCPAGSDLEGVVVLEEQANVICNLNIPEIFTCPDTSDIAGAQVTDLLICDLDNVELFTCPPNSNMGGAVVTDVALCQAPDDDNKCPIGSDLENVYVMNPDTDCDVFEECVAGDPIFSALPPGSANFEVVDETICELVVPSQVALFTCGEDSNLGAGAVVTDAALCNAATPAEQCPAGTQLENVWVTDATDANCSVDGLTLLECPLGTNLAGAIVTDDALCDLTDVELDECPAGSENAGALTTDLTFCDAPGDGNICPGGTDLAGVYVATVPGDCDLDIDDCENCDLNFEICPSDTDLAFHYVTVANEDTCCIAGGDGDDDNDGLAAGGLKAQQTPGPGPGEIDCPDDNGGDDNLAANNAQIQPSSSNTQSSQNAKLTNQNMEQKKTSDTPVQASNIQSNQETKISNQNVEVNKQIEEQKKSSVLPLFDFNTK
jgi:hypothetical protein